MEDDILKIIDEFDKADIIVSVSPSYWADIPGQYFYYHNRRSPVHCHVLGEESEVDK